MFFHLQLSKDIEVEPRHFGPNLQQILKQKVTSEASEPSGPAPTTDKCKLLACTP